MAEGVALLLLGPRFIDLLRLKQGKGQPIRADEPVLACPAPNGLVWHMHASLVQCLARLTNATIEQTARALVRE